jgi:hypothetical protein
LKKIDVVIALLMLTILACKGSSPAIEIPTINVLESARQTMAVQITKTVPSTQASTTKEAPTAMPANPEIPTDLPTKTEFPTAVPTDTPIPTKIPLPPILIPYAGNGDSVIDIDIDRIGGVGVLKIEGNSSSRFFGVNGIDISGNPSELYVMSTEPYSGIRPININNSAKIRRLEIKATGEWTISLMSLSPELLRSIQVPGTLSGKGDEVILISGATPDVAKIIGNQSARFFGINAYTTDSIFSINPLVMTTDPYNGTVILPSTTFIIEINAVGDWSIEIKSK